MFKKHRKFAFFKNKQASKITSGTENVTSLIYENFILELYFGTFHFDISIILLWWR